MSIEKITKLFGFVDQFDSGMTAAAWQEVRALRRVARALVDGGLDWRSGDSGDYIEAVKFIHALAKEKP